MKERIFEIRARMRLAALFAITFVAVTVMLVLISGAFQIFSNYQGQREILFSQQQLVAQEAAADVSDFIEDKFNVLETAVTLENVAAVPQADQERILGNALGFQPAFRQLALYDASGALLTHSSRLVASRSQGFIDETTILARQFDQSERYISSVSIDAASSEPFIVIAVPILDVFGDYQGMLAAEINLKFMWDLVDQLDVGETGYAYVVDRQGKLLAFVDTARVLRGENVSQLIEVGEFVEGKDVDTDGAYVGPGILGDDTLQTFAGLGAPDWAVVTEVPTREAFQSVVQAIIRSAIAILGSAILAGAAGIALSRWLTGPITILTETAAQVAQGNLDLRAQVEGNVEVNQLASAFNNMTAQLQELIGSLEQRVAERTRALEISGSVSRQLSNILERQALVTAVVELVKEAFDYYHAHIYLFDDKNQNLIMVGGTGQAGQQMLANHHQIPAGRGLVGRAGQSGRPVLVPDTSQDEAWLPNPLLPETKAEVAVPIITSGQILGVLDVQQNITGGLTQADVDLLEAIASQVAVGLRNASLYEASQQQASRETLLNEINQKILKTTDVDEAMQVAIREIGRALNASQTIIRFKQEGETDDDETKQKAQVNGVHGQRRF